MLAERGAPLGESQVGHGTAIAQDASGPAAERTWKSAFLPASATRGLVMFAIEHTSPEDSLPLIPPVDRAGSVDAVDHVVVMSPDLDASKALYEEVLGLRLALDRSFEKRGVRLVFFRVGGLTVEIGGRLGADPDPESTDRFGGLAYQVPDADAAQSRLSAAGFDVSEVRDGHKPGTRVFTVRDAPAGVPILILQPVG
jgi:catechol 2,3-dioxygenase-like lactoylglutathione lyase family enzyme